ncbi:Uma2 family endonuclease [uncultured Enterovirga sp.]|uniref:Uma2 family endonuclease n=1 Tax=uncultured Enterovirga sp. TaxID=2026352 RepID=UPI0035CBF006
MSSARAMPLPATYADIEALPEHLVGEIIDGMLETYPRPRPRHGAAASALSYELTGPFQRGRGGPGGWVFIVEPELHLGHQVVVPDLAGWRRERLTELPDTAYLETAPDWVCEVLSPSTARVDRGAKRRIYAGGRDRPSLAARPGRGRARGFRTDRLAVAATRHHPARRRGPGRALRRDRFPDRRPLPFDTPSTEA